MIRQSFTNHSVAYRGEAFFIYEKGECMLIKNPVYLVQEVLKKMVNEGDTVVDATCGNGNDTAFLAQCVGASGKVIAFDIQEQAVENTRVKLKKAGFEDRVALILDGHQHMDQYVTGPIACAMFNLGFLPGSDHKIQTNWPDTLCAITKAMELLKKGGVITVIIYYGKDTGYTERDKVLEFLKGIDTDKYNVLKIDYLNRSNDPPIPIIIEKN